MHQPSDDPALREQLAEVTWRLEQIERQLTSLSVGDDEAQRLRSELAALGSRHRVTSENLKKLHSRKAVRAALTLADRAGPLVRPVQSIRSNIARRRRARDDQRTLALLRQRGGRTPTTSRSLVSIVIPTRDGATKLEAALQGLAATTDYEPFEVIVVDNGSSDSTQELLARTWPFAIQSIVNPRNRSFSEACNQGAAAANGEHLLFLNNDIVPINPGWLRAMVDSATDDVAAVGAVLVYPPQPGTGHDIPNSMRVQHRGIAFSWYEGAPRGLNLGSGEDPTDLAAGPVEVPAATAACLMVAAEPFRAVGGFSEDFVYGWEDVDLCLKLRAAGGTVVVSRDAFLTHEESGSLELLSNDVRNMHFRSNSVRFWDRWSGPLSELVMRDQLAGAGFWAMDGVRTAAITLSSNRQEDGFGDWYTAHELGDALAAAGWEVRYAARADDAWYDIPPVDLLVSLLPQYDVSRAPAGAYKIAWVRNWVDRWTGNDSFRRYDLAAIATEAFRAPIESSTAVETFVAPLATNPERFQRTAVNPTFECDYALVANNWGSGRAILNSLSEDADERFNLYGKNWENWPRAQRQWRGHVDYADLPALYSSVAVLLDDTVAPNRPALNARVFDAIATGTLVITDNATGSDEFFDGVLPAFADRGELRDLLDRYLADPAARGRSVDALRKMVLARHTYALRAEEFVTRAVESLSSPRIGLRIGPPSWNVAERWGDTHFARHFAVAARKFGYATRIDVLEDWDSPAAQAVDVAVHVRGLIPYVPKPTHFNVLWLISHPEDVTARECDRFDLVLVASEQHAQALAREVSVPVHVLPQATHFDLGPPDPSDPANSRILFVGNTRGSRRSAVDWAIESGIEVDVYGSGWDGIIPRRYIRADHIPNENLAQAYRDAAIVLNDHWPDMRDQGFVSNRILDVLGAGGFVISDAVAGLDALLGDAVPTFRTKGDLAALIERYLSDVDARDEKRRKGYEAVLKMHTFAQRAAAFDEIVRPAIDARTNPLRQSTPVNAN